MITIQTILCPSDLSAESDEALRYAVTLANTYKAKLLLLHCTGRKSAGPGESQTPRHDIAQRFERALLNHLGLVSLKDLNWEVLAIDNVRDIGATIALQAREHNADLIIMRSRRRPRAAIILGSTAETVCRTASCPVLITHPSEREWVGFSTGEIDLQRVLVTYDFSNDSELALSYGISLAQEYQSELHLLHVLPSSQAELELTWEDTDAANTYARVVRKLQEAVPKEVFLWCKFVNSVRFGLPHEEVLAYAKQHEIDLICMGASGSSRSLSKLFGSNGERILRGAPCPVLVARPTNSTKSASTNVAELLSERSAVERKVL